MGSIDWKWLIIGIVLALFVWPFVTNMFLSRKTAAPANA